MIQRDAVDKGVEGAMCGTRRRDAYDLARGVAFVLMVVAHTAPSDGPFRILLTSEFLTAPLFATLVGCGIELAHRAHGGTDLRLLAQHWMRGALVAGLGLLLALSQAQIVIVLVQLGVLMAVVPLLTWLPSLWLTVLALLTFVGSVLARELTLAGAEGVVTWFGTGPYRPLAFLGYALLGVLLVRWVESMPRRGMLLGQACAMLALMLGLLVVPNFAGYGVHAYDGSALETAGNAFGAAGIVLLCAWADSVAPVGQQVRALVAAPGRAALTLYVLQVVVLHLWTVTMHIRDDSWVMVAGLAVGGCAFAVVWSVLVRGRFRRGPLEGLLSLALEPLRR